MALKEQDIVFTTTDEAAVFDYKNFKFVNPFAQSPVSWTHTTPPI